MPIPSRPPLSNVDTGRLRRQRRDDVRLRFVVLVLAFASLLAIGCIPVPWGVPPVAPVDADLTTVEPAHGSTLEAPPAVIRAVVRFPIDASRIGPESLGVLAAGSAVAGTVAVDPAAGRVLLFTPAAELPRGIVLTGFVGDLFDTAGSRRRTRSEFVFTIHQPGQSECELGVSAVVWAGQVVPELWSPARVDADSLGVAFAAGERLQGAAFWHEPSRAWSPVSETPVPSRLVWGARDVVPDGAGGLHQVSAGLAVHHDRGASSAVHPIAAEQVAAFRHADGATRLWPQAWVTGPSSVASLTWEVASRTWRTDLGVAPAGSMPPMVPGVGDQVQAIVADATVASGVSLLARPRDRFGAPSPEVELATFRALHAMAVCHAEGRAMLVAAVSTEQGDRLVALDFTVDGGWSGPVTILAPIEVEGLGIASLAVAASGPAVVYVSGERGGDVLAVRDPGGAWSSGPPSVPPERVRVTADDAGFSFAMAHDGTGEVWVSGRRAGSPWSAAFGLRALGAVPGTGAARLHQVELVAAPTHGRCHLLLAMAVVGAGMAPGRIESRELRIL